MEDGFIEYMTNARNEFTNEINVQRWNGELRTAAEDLLICFDQMRERLLSRTTIPKVEPGRYGMMNVFTDGWFFPFANTDEETCEWLNNNPHKEEYRLLTKEEAIFLFTNRQQGFL